MSKIIVSKLQNGTGPELTLPTVDGIAGQVLALGVLNDLKFKDVTKIVSTPPTTSTVAVAGDILLNNQNGVIYYCVAVQASPYKAFWLGTDGFSAGFPQGQFVAQYTVDTSTQGTTTQDFPFTVPAFVTSLGAVLVGSGGGGNPNWSSAAGGGGALAWANNIPVTPGEVLTLRLRTVYTPHSNIGAATTLLRGSTVLFAAEGGQHSATSLSQIAKPVAGLITPGNMGSGRGGLTHTSGYGGGGGAGGYTGNGGNGHYGSSGNSNNTFNTGVNGTGGAAAGGSGYQSSTYGFTGGGGVGLFGEGASGVGFGRGDGPNSHDNNFTSYPTGGGSGGERGAPQGNSSITDTQSFGADLSGMGKVTGGGVPTGSMTRYHGQGGRFGGGGGGGGTSNNGNAFQCTGGPGGARIIWGRGRAFPNTQTGDVTPEA